MSLNRFPVMDGKTTFGMHLMLDAYNIPKNPLDDMKLIYRFLYDLPEEIGMSKLTMPMVVDADKSATEFDPGGISGFVMINESHISIHTFPDKGFLTMDVYSCSNFEDQVEKILSYIKSYFPYKQEELQIVKRGTRYPIAEK